MNFDCPDCESARRKLEAFIDRELTDIEAVQVKRHLQECSDCERCFDFEDGVKQLVRRKACPESAPPHLAARIRSLLSSS